MTAQGGDAVLVLYLAWEQCTCMVGRLTGEEGCIVPVLCLYKSAGRAGAGQEAAEENRCAGMYIPVGIL